MYCGCWSITITLLCKFLNALPLQRVQSISRISQIAQQKNMMKRRKQVPMPEMLVQQAQEYQKPKEVQQRQGPQLMVASRQPQAVVQFKELRQSILSAYRPRKTAPSMAKIRLQVTQTAIKQHLLLPISQFWPRNHRQCICAKGIQRDIQLLNLIIRLIIIQHYQTQNFHHLHQSWQFPQLQQKCIRKSLNEPLSYLYQFMFYLALQELESSVEQPTYRRRTYLNMCLDKQSSFLLIAFLHSSFTPQTVTITEFLINKIYIKVIIYSSSAAGCHSTVAGCHSTVAGFPDRFAGLDKRSTQRTADFGRLQSRLYFAGHFRCRGCRSSALSHRRHSRRI